MNIINFGHSLISIIRLIYETKLKIVLIIYYIKFIQYFNDLHKVLKERLQYRRNFNGHRRILFALVS